MCDINFDEALKVYDNQERIIERQSEDYEKLLVKHSEALKKFQLINDDVFNDESVLSNEKWKSFGSANIALSNRAKFELYFAELIRKSEDFRKTDKTKNIQNLIQIGESISTNIKELDSHMDVEILQIQVEEFKKKRQLCMEKLNICKEQYRFLKDLQLKPTEYEVPYQNYY